MAGIYGLHYFMIWCVVVSSGGAGQSDDGAKPQPGQQPNAEPGGVVGRLDELQDLLELLLERAEQDSVALGTQLQLINGTLAALEQHDIQTTERHQKMNDRLAALEQHDIQTTERHQKMNDRLAALEQHDIQTTERLQKMDDKLAGLSIAVTKLAQRNMITCPEGYDTPCGDMCYRLEGDTWCDDDGGRWPVPMSQEAITCLLALTSDTSLPVYTHYDNGNGANFTSRYNTSVVAPAELVGEPGPGGESNEQFVIIHRNSGLLVRSKWLDDEEDGQAWVCEKPPLE